MLQHVAGLDLRNVVIRLHVRTRMYFRHKQLLTCEPFYLRTQLFVVIDYNFSSTTERMLLYNTIFYTFKPIFFKCL